MKDEYEIGMTEGRCPICGAKPGAPCTPIDDLGSFQQGNDIATWAHHGRLQLAAQLKRKKSDEPKG